MSFFNVGWIFFFIGLGLTILIEAYALELIFKLKFKKYIKLVTAINLVSYPIANFLLNNWHQIFNTINPANLALVFQPFLLTELLVIVIEVVLIKLTLKYSYIKSLIVSFCINFITAILSLFILYLSFYF